MNRCLELAKHGMGMVAPNPMVGAVLVADGKIVAEGFHQRFGGPHAEVVAIDRVKDKTLLQKCTLYVSLEPCSHYGKTPPCADLIINSGIKKVVVATMDPNPMVSGKGIKRLRDAGIAVTTGILEKESRFLNRRFFVAHQLKRPYIILKWAVSSDGFMDPVRKNGEKGSIPITGKDSRKQVHLWRSQEQAILIGAGTAITDNPSLTVRDVDGKNPLRVIIDPNNRCSTDLSIFNNQADTLLFNCSQRKDLDPSIQFTLSKDSPLLPQVLEELYRRNIHSVFVEGGAKTLSFFLSSEIWDEARILTADQYFMEGLKAPEIKGIHQQTFLVGKDRVSIIFRERETF